MIELIQFPWSPFCIVQRRILEFSGANFKITNIPNNDRSLVWRMTGHRYYSVPIIRDGKKVIFETSEESQVIAKYLDGKLGLDLFPWDREGEQRVLWQYIENEIEGLSFKLNDIFYREFVPPREQLGFVRHKERKFGRGCIEQWADGQAALLAKLQTQLVPFEEMLLHRPFLLEQKPHFVDFDLYGMLGNFLYTGHYRLPKEHTGLKRWFARMTHLEYHNSAREKELHSRYQRPAARSALPAGLRGQQRPAAHRSAGRNRPL